MVCGMDEFYRIMQHTAATTRQLCDYHCLIDMRGENCCLCVPCGSALLTFSNVLVQAFICSVVLCLQCFDAVGWAAGRASGL